MMPLLALTNFLDGPACVLSGNHPNPVVNLQTFMEPAILDRSPEPMRCQVKTQHRQHKI